MPSLLIQTRAACTLAIQGPAAAAAASAALQRATFSDFASGNHSQQIIACSYYSDLAKPKRNAYTTRNISTSPTSFSRSFATSTSNNMATLNAIKSNCRKVMCIGRNFADHVKELNNQRPKQPFFFLKPPSSILLPREGAVLRPKGVNLHYEVELGIVIGKTVRDLDERDEAGWLSAIDSYLLTIDMTGRNVQDEAKKKGLPWSIAKGFDTFLPVAGPIAKDKIADPHNVDLWLSVNGQMKQEDNTELMLFRIGRQLSDISKVMTLEKGDIVLTGTPKGVGQVVTGDVIEAGLRIGGQEVEEAKIRVDIQDREGPYEFAET